LGGSALQHMFLAVFSYSMKFNIIKNIRCITKDNKTDWDITNRTIGSFDYYGKIEHSLKWKLELENPNAIDYFSDIEDMMWAHIICFGIAMLTSLTICIPRLAKSTGWIYIKTALIQTSALIYLVCFLNLMFMKMAFKNLDGYLNKMHSRTMKEHEHNKTEVVWEEKGDKVY
jgi:hypothetical protein